MNRQKFNLYRFNGADADTKRSDATMADDADASEKPETRRWCGAVLSRAKWTGTPCQGSSTD